MRIGSSYLEPTRQCLLLIGLLFAFFGSETGQMVCFRVFRILRSSYYLALALLAACGALFFHGLGILLSWLAEWMRRLRKTGN